MIVPVQLRAFSTALTGFGRKARVTHQESSEPRGKEKGKGLFDSIERLMSHSTNLMMHDLTKE